MPADRARIKYVLAHMQGNRQRLFTGRYRDRCSIAWPATPITTGKPARAKLYDDQIVAETMACIFNLLDVAYAGVPRKWVAMPLPERATQ